MTSAIADIQQPLTNVSAQASSLTPGATGVTFTLKFTTATRTATSFFFTFPDNFVPPSITATSGYSVKLAGVSQNMSTFASSGNTYSYNTGPTGPYYGVLIAPNVAVPAGSAVEITLLNGVIPNPVTSLQFHEFCTNNCTPTEGEKAVPWPSLALPPTTPDAPTNGAATAGNRQVSVNWTAPASDGGAAITGYQVQVSTSSGGTYTDAAGTCAPATTNISTALTCTASGLTNGTQYFFKVAAINSLGTGSYSAASSGATPVVPPPAPTVTAISPTSGSTAGGTAVTLTGTNLTGASAVTIGGAACTSVNPVSATSLTCTTPALTAGIASVLVTTSGGTNAANTLFTYITPNFIARLNDSGATQCTDAGATLLACSAANTGNNTAYPRQDARFGRDAAQAEGKLLPAKTGGGAAGFDFTPLDATGNAIALDGPPSTHACVHDNVTNLTWEVKTSSGLRSNAHTYTWYNGRTGTLGTDTCGGTLAASSNQCNTNNYVQAVNAASPCGAGSNPWRVPTRRELLSIVHHGANTPAIDPDYFPSTNSNSFWTSDVYAFAPTASAWYVEFDIGVTRFTAQSGSYPVRLVRNGL